MRTLRFWLTILAVCWLGPPPAVGFPAQTQHVILLSLDGARPDAIKATLPKKLIARAAIMWRAKTISPSLTLPSHASMLAGVPPAQHRVKFNDWREGAAYFSGKTILTEVTRTGGRVAAIVHKRKLLMLAPPHSIAHAEALPYPRFKQRDVVAYAVRYFRRYRPMLLFVHVADPDDAGHRYGWMTPEYLKVIADIPALIDRLLLTLDETGVSNQAVLIVTADHGGHDRTHGTNRPEDMTIPWMVFGNRARAGAVLERPVITYDTATTVLATLGRPVPKEWRGRLVREAFR